MSQKKAIGQWYIKLKRLPFARNQTVEILFQLLLSLDENDESTARTKKQQQFIEIEQFDGEKKIWCVAFTGSSTILWLGLFSLR